MKKNLIMKIIKQILKNIRRRIAGLAFEVIFDKKNIIEVRPNVKR